MLNQSLASIRALTFAALSSLTICTQSSAADVSSLSTVSASLPVQDIELEAPQQNLLAQIAPEEKLKNLKQGVSTHASNLDKTIKYGIVTAGIVVGVGLAYFYGPALAATLAYEASMKLSFWMAPKQTAFTYYMFTKPAAIDAAVYFANSSLVQGGLAVASSGLGYGLGELGTSVYEGIKTAASATYTAVKSVVEATPAAVSTMASKIQSGWSWLSNKVSSAAISYATAY